MSTTPKMDASLSGPTLNSSPISYPSHGPPLPEEPDPLASLTDVSQLWLKFGKTFLMMLPIYVLGYFEFSFSWVLVGLAALFYWRRNHSEQDNRINRALRFLEHEESVTQRSAATTQLPPWVHYPDVERVEWLNKTVKQMWPFICQFVDKLFRETIEPSVKTASPYLSSFCFTKIDLGDKPLRVNGVKVYTENVDKRQVIMDLEVSFVGNTEIDIDIKKFYCRAGIKNIQLHGVMRVVMEPLLGDMPLIGALSVFFLKKPWLDINWTGLTNMLDIPGVNGLSDGLIQDIICQFLVLPNKISIPLVGEAQLAQMRFPVPKGVLRIHFLEAHELLGKDKFLGGLIKGKSDPYGVLQVGTQLFQSKVVHETVNPKWNEVYEALIYDSSTAKNLELELFDEDTDKDDFLGSLVIDLAELQKEQKVDEWFVLEEVSQGKLHLKLEWLSLLPKPDQLDQVLSSIRADRGHANDGLSSAVLVVFLDSARNLPSVFEGSLGPGVPLAISRNTGFVFCENTSSLYRTLFTATVSKVLKTGKKVTSEPSPFVLFNVGHKSFESKTRYKTNEPVWEEAFTFLIHNPKTQELEVEVRDEKHECSLGKLSVSLIALMDAPDMTLNRSFPLRSSGPTCSLKMKLALRLLCLEKDSTPSNGLPSAVQVRKSSSTPRPSISSDSGLQNHSDPVSVSSPTGAELHNGRNQSGLNQSSLNLNAKEPTPSIASDISNPYAAQELQYRLSQLPNGSAHFPLGEIQLTLRQSSQRNRLIVVVHSCRNLIAFSEHGSDPYVRLYLLPDKRRSGRRKTSTFKKNQNPVYDQTFEFSVSVVELHRRTLDVAVKNGGGLLSKHKGLLGKVLVDLTHDDITKGWTQWFELSEDGMRRPQLL